LKDRLRNTNPVIRETRSRKATKTANTAPIFFYYLAKGLQIVGGFTWVCYSGLKNRRCGSFSTLF